MNTILQIHEITKSYSLENKGDRPVLSGINFSVNTGEFLALVGPSGAGKSTLLHLIGLLDTADSGTIALSLESHNYSYPLLSKKIQTQLRNAYIGFIFQFHHLLPEFSAIENVMMPRLLAGISKQECLADAKILMERVGVSHRENHKPSELSGGEQQRVAIARALINKPQLLLADEPTGNLDTANTESVLELLQSVRREYNVTCIVATHSQQVASLADRILVMKDGKIVE
ncbi:MAG TPA: ABC transporter ATP-binding protein [Candidatus Kapabacteria bacterium]|nr:ABC transporter ATP-binding protein [Candidatus Kapabacteria bacterium]